jgi:hypothetical protein
MSTSAPFKVRWEKIILQGWPGPKKDEPIPVELPLPAIAVAMAVASRANSDGGSIFATQETIRRGLGLGKTSAKVVGKWLQVLEDAGWLLCEKRGGRGNGSTRYRLTIPAAPETSMYVEVEREPGTSTNVEVRDPWAQAEVESTSTIVEVPTSTDVEVNIHDRGGTGSTDVDATNTSTNASTNTPTNSEERAPDPWDEVERELAERDASAAAEGAYVPSWQRLRP